MPPWVFYHGYYLYQFEIVLIPLIKFHTVSDPHYYNNKFIFLYFNTIIILLFPITETEQVHIKYKFLHGRFGTILNPWKKLMLQVDSLEL